MRLRPFLLAAALLMTLPVVAAAGTPTQVKVKCPLGGQEFSHTTTASYSTFGSRPDGKPYANWLLPLMLPICPVNGLVVYRDFSEAEVARLADLIATPAYRELRNTETAYFRAAWLERTLAPGAESVAWLLLQASWEADGAPDQRARYLRDFATTAAALKVEPGLPTIGLQLRIANAWREVGEFDRARGIVQGLSFDAPADTRDARADLKGTRDYADRLLKVIDRRDSGSEPLDLLPPQIAAQICADDEAGRVKLAGFCEASPMAVEVAKVRRAMKAQAR